MKFDEEFRKLEDFGSTAVPGTALSTPGPCEDEWRLVIYLGTQPEALGTILKGSLKMFPGYPVLLTIWLINISVLEPFSSEGRNDHVPRTKKCMLHTSSLQYGCCIARRNCTHTHAFLMDCLNMCDHIISYSSAQFNYNVMVFKYSLCHTILYPTGGFGESYVWANRDFLQHLLPLDVDDVDGLHTIRFMINVSNFS